MEVVAEISPNVGGSGPESGPVRCPPEQGGGEEAALVGDVGNLRPWWRECYPRDTVDVDIIHV